MKKTLLPVDIRSRICYLCNGFTAAIAYAHLIFVGDRRKPTEGAILSGARISGQDREGNALWRHP